MKLSVVFPVFNQFPLTTTALDMAISNLSGENEVEVIILDNASDTPFTYPIPRSFPIFNQSRLSIREIRTSHNIGVYPTFWWGLSESTGDVVAFFHSDLMISEKDWDKRLMQAFQFPEYRVGMIGFIGSNEIDSSGGRGRGTTSNFQGAEYKNSSGMGSIAMWRGSPAEAHGHRYPGYTKAAVVDGCAMVFKRAVLEGILQRPSFPPHHFYDRLLSCEVRELGYEMGVLGIGCDHISGQTVNQEPKYNDMAQAWAEAHGLTMEGVHNWDSVLYREAERQWLAEYRDKKHLVPCSV